MPTHIHKPMRLAIRTWRTIWVAAIPLFLANACSDSAREATRERVDVAAATGRLQLNLSAEADGGRVYQLKNATFTITATSNRAAREVRVDAARARLSLELSPDGYEVLLNPGYELERSQGSSVSTVEATLISDNPALITIAADTVTPLDFAFRVADVDIETGVHNGRLDLGIDVLVPGEVGAEVDCSDAFEPNDDQPLASLLTPEQPATASVCGADLDYFRFSAPVPAGELFRVRSDILASERADFVLLAAVIDPTIVSDDVNDSVVGALDPSFGPETLILSNGGEYLVRVWMEGSPFVGGFDPDLDPNLGIAYRLTVGAYENTAVNGCCDTSDAGGCNDDATVLCVCAADPKCCVSGYDEWCVASAQLECGTQCASPAESDCCAASSAPGCTVPDVEACVCQIDPYCCFGGFDQNCAVLAETRCAAGCTP